jgi:hypothetical protein
LQALEFSLKKIRLSFSAHSAGIPKATLHEKGPQKQSNGQEQKLESIAPPGCKTQKCFRLIDMSTAQKKMQVRDFKPLRGKLLGYKKMSHNIYKLLFGPLKSEIEIDS